MCGLVNFTVDQVRQLMDKPTNIRMSLGRSKAPALMMTCLLVLQVICPVSACHSFAATMQ